MGNGKNGGREWHPVGEPEQVKVHDFIDPALGKPNPASANQPESGNPRLVEFYRDGGCTISELKELFCVACSTIYRVVGCRT